MKIQESAEMYLETIFVLSKKNAGVRSIDIVNELDYTKPSVSVAMKNLRQRGYIDIDAGGFITLTASGRKVAENIYERHTLITDFFMRLGVNKEAALQDACKMEHILSKESFAAIKRYMEEQK